jgi:hypothetical protein
MKLTKCEAVRRLLAPGRWVTMDAMRRAGGWRYGARLWDLAQRGVQHETKRDPRTGGYMYRWRTTR